MGCHKVTRELELRMTLGAGVSDLIRHVARSSSDADGIILGTTAALTLTRLTGEKSASTAYVGETKHRNRERIHRAWKYLGNNCA